MDVTSIKKIVDNNEEISRLLTENERIIRDLGYKPLVSNISIPNELKIKVPSGYIRTSATFWKQYHLNDIVRDYNVKNNISYALQLSDYYNYFLSRFNVWGSIEVMFYKQAFVNIVSIIEALILESANNINLHCQNCPNIGTCKKNICKRQRENMKNAATRLVELNILEFEPFELGRLLELYDLRNKIHIRLNENNEFVDKKFNRELYNESVVFLRKVDLQLFSKAVQFYNSCMAFETNT